MEFGGVDCRCLHFERSRQMPRTERVERAANEHAVFARVELTAQVVLFIARVECQLEF